MGRWILFSRGTIKKNVGKSRGRALRSRCWGRVKVGECREWRHGTISARGKRRGARVSVGHGPIIFIWKAGNATRKGETDNKKNLLPNRGKTQKSITEGREIRTPRERERTIADGAGGVMYWNCLKKNSLSLFLAVGTANNIDEVFIFRWGWPISYLPVIHFLCVKLKKTLSIGSWDLISSPDEVLSICFNKIQKIYWAKIGYHRKSYNSSIYYNP